MARVRGGGGATVSAWALVIFGAGFFICLLLSIILYMQLSTAQQLAEDAQAELSQFVSTSERSSPDVVPLLDRQAEGTVVGQLLQMNQSLRSLITTDADFTIEGLRETLTAMQINPPLLGEIERLEAELAARDAQIEQLERDLANARDRAEAAERQMAEVIRKRDEAVANLQEQIDKIAADYDAYRQQVEQTTQELQTQVATVRQEQKDRIAELESQLQQAEQEKLVIQQKLEQCQRTAAKVGPPDVVMPDGRIASVAPDGDKVYIDLGRLNHLVLGMTFEVFDADELVRPEDNANQPLRGKATIEVLSIGETSSVARVVRRDRGAVVSEGDQIINVVYDPDATYRFFVYGDFDIDNTGEPTVADLQRIQSMIRRWGGGVADELTYDVDYLVLGIEPPLPDPLPPGTIDPVRIREHAEAMQKYERYQSLVAEARDRSIPILNQNRFLALVGHYER